MMVQYVLGACALHVHDDFRKCLECSCVWLLCCAVMGWVICYVVRLIAILAVIRTGVVRTSAM